MATKFQAGRARWKAFMARRSRIGRLSVRCLVLLALAILLYNAHVLRIVDVITMVFTGAILVPLLPILIYRWISRRVLWKVRNRLILTYLLMGLSPVVLFGTLGGIAAYLFTGQYATNAALTSLTDTSLKLREETATEAGFSLAEQTPHPQTPHSSPVPLDHPTQFSGSPVSVSPVSIYIDEDDHWRTLITPANDPSNQDTIEPLLLAGEAPPAWLKPGFHGIVSAKGHLYLCSETHAQPGDNSVLVVGSIPITVKELGKMAKGLGTITLMHGFSRTRDNSGEPTPAIQLDDKDLDDDAPPTPSDAKPPNAALPPKPTVAPARNKDKHPDKNSTDDPAKTFDVRSFSKTTGGKLPLPAHFYDIPVVFSLPTEITAWQTGDKVPLLLMVESRPTLLYAHLFSTSVGLGNFIGAVLIAITVFFLVIEIFSLLMAISLSRTITRSVADLYRGTREIDAGHLDHRIRVAKYDQLGALASSFNGMASSISQLLVQQSEKERLLNELKIAQEVQTTLFPESPATLGGFEMHAMSLPARTVGGDYFDFIFGPGNNLCLALGDISGKGISAALLMASLNSAVRAFILGYDANAAEVAESPTPSPAMLLTLLNRHLYLSTQSSRYATLFLAAYNVEARTLTYANGGHLAPLVLSTDGTVRRLDVGGSVVGLLEDLEYEEATVQLEPGDLLVAFTDGLTEPENTAALEFGEHRLLDYIAHYRQLPLPILAAATLKTLQDWIGEGEQPDDMTILLARQL